MQLLSIGSFYLGIEADKYCDISTHFGNLVIEYQCPSAKSNDEPRPTEGPTEGGDGLPNGEIGTSN